MHFLLLIHHVVCAWISILGVVCQWYNTHDLGFKQVKTAGAEIVQGWEQLLFQTAGCFELTTVAGKKRCPVISSTGGCWVRQMRLLYCTREQHENCHTV